MRRSMAVIAAAITVIAALAPGRSMPRLTGSDAYPQPPIAGPTMVSKYAGLTVDEVARMILATWKQRGLASDDASILSAMSITEADAACFGIGQGIISAGDPIDIAVLIAGTAIRSDMPSMNDAASPYGLLIVDREIGWPFAQMWAPTLDMLEADLDCASSN